MRSIKSLLVLCLAVSVVGCASQPRPPIDAGSHTALAKTWAATQVCGIQGNISPETVALGVVYLTSALSQYSINSEGFNSEMQYWAKQRPIPASKCNEIAILIAQRKQQIDIQNQNTALQRQEMDRMLNNQPKRTVCNNIAGQILCSTY